MNRNYRNKEKNKRKNAVETFPWHPKKRCSLVEGDPNLQKKFDNSKKNIKKKYVA